MVIEILYSHIGLVAKLIYGDGDGDGEMHVCLDQDVMCCNRMTQNSDLISKKTD